MRCSESGSPPRWTTGTPPVRTRGRGVGTRSVRSYAVMPLRYATAAPPPERCGRLLRGVARRPGRTPEGRRSAADVVAQLVALGLQLGEPVLDDVTDADDGGERAVGGDDRHVPHP